MIYEEQICVSSRSETRKSNVMVLEGLEVLIPRWGLACYVPGVGGHLVLCPVEAEEKKGG